MPLSLFEKIWQRHEVMPESPEQPALLYVSLHLLHEITSLQAFAALEARARKVRRPDLTLALVDHCAPTRRDLDGQRLYKDAATKAQIEALVAYCHRHQVRCFDLDHAYQGIVHAVAPELGWSRPGQVIVCGDSHTSTHGAFGAIAFGIGTSEVFDVLATQCILQRKPRNMLVRVRGRLPEGCSAKDLALTIIKTLGADGGKGYAIEYQGEAISALSMEERLTLCNMTIEAGSRFGLIAPDAKTLAYLRSCPEFDHNTELPISELHSDADTPWDKIIDIDADDVQTMLTWGTNPAMAMPIDSLIPAAQNTAEAAALRYMGWTSGQSPRGRPVQQVFIGSCTNGRLSDLRAAAAVLKNHKIAPEVQCLVVPASRLIQKSAEAEGLDVIFKNAGAVWGEPSCSLCNAMNGDEVPAGQLAVSTSNRNFEGRQGPNARTILASPRTAAAIAIRGSL